MYIGGAIFLLAAGAILSFAVEDSVSGLDIVMVGYILMAAGALGLVLRLFMMNSGDSGGQGQAARRDPNHPRY